MIKTINLIKRKWIIIILIYLLLPTYSIGQNLIDTDLGAYPDGTTFAFGRINLPGIHLNEIKNFEIPVLVDMPYTITPPTGSGPCTEINSNNSVTIVNDHFIRVQVTNMCNFDQSSYVDFTLNISKTGSGFIPENHLYRVPILRDTVKVVLTLDISGSMGITLDDGTTTRLQALKDASYELITKLEEFQQAGDSLGLTYFTTNVVQPAVTNFPKDFIPIAGDFTSLIAVNADLDPITPQQMTAMGSGLLDAKTKLLKNKENAPNTKRMAFLFTDGRQNQYPMVLADGIELEGSQFLNDNQPNPKDSIRYFVLATWDAGVTIETLIKIGEESGGATTYANPAADLTTWFNDQLTNMLSDGSPQVITNKEGNTITDSIKYIFDLNEGVTKLVVDLSSAKEDSLIVKVKKNGKYLTHKAKERIHDNYKLLSFTFPVSDNNYIHSGGNWEVAIIGNTNKPYHLSAIADDHYLEFNCNTDKKIYTVGDPIKLSTFLSYANDPLFGGTNSVKAIVLKPGEDLGNLLATAQTPDMDSIIDMGDGASMKFQELMANDSAFYNAILPDEQIIDLTDNGTGLFSGEFVNTDYTGIYNIIFLVKGETNGYGKFERTDIISSVFKFGQVEEEQPEVVDNPPASTGNAPQYTVLRIRPKNKFGNYMGPGFKSKIKISINNKPIRLIKSARAQKVSETDNVNAKSDPYLENIVDNLDGSYLIYVANVISEDNPEITITVRDETLYEGKLYPIPFWFYIIVIIIIIILLLLQRNKSNPKIYKILMYILLLICLLIYLLQKFGILYIL